MHVAIDQAGKDQTTAVVDGFGRRWQPAFADRRDRRAADRDMAVVDDCVGGDDGADDHTVEGC